MGARVHKAAGFVKLKTSLVRVQGQRENLQYYVMRRDTGVAAGSHGLLNQVRVVSSEEPQRPISQKNCFQ